MKIYLGSDHAGYEFKNKLTTYLLKNGYSIEDMGAFVFDKEDDYPDFITPVAKAVSIEAASVGIILGGSGQGEAMCANRIKGIRAMVFYGSQKPVLPVDSSGRESSDIFEIIRITREHDCANILSLGMRFISENDAIHAIDLFLNTQNSVAQRHIRRITKY